MPRWTVALALLVAATALAPSLATATTATDLCPLVADPCVVSADIAVDPNSVIDLGGRALDVKNRASLTIASGTMTILARSMHVEIGGALLGKSTTNGGVIVVNVVQDITIDGNTTTQGRIDVSAGVAAGEMDLTAGTTMTVSGLLTANATTPNGDGGTVNVNAGTDVSITGPIAVAGGAGGTGGSVTMVAGGALNITQPIDASGGDSGGGSIDLTAGGDLVTAGKLDVSGGGNSGDGGFLSWQAGGAVRILGPVNGKASGTIDTGGGDAVLAVPNSAVIDSGERQIVLVDKGGGRFEPRTVQLGRHGAGYVEIRDGLKVSENVVFPWVKELSQL